MLRIDKVWAVLVVFLASACWILPGADCFGQGFLLISEHDHPIRLPRPFPPHPPIERPNPEVLYRVKHLEVDTRIRDSIARVQLSQTFVNEGSQVVEARCIVPLPYDVVVSDVTFMVDGQEIVGKLLPVAEANQIYQGYVQRNKDPALVQWMGCGLLQTNVFPIPPGKERTVSIGYSQVLPKINGMMDWHLPLKAAGYSTQPIEKVTVNVFVEHSTKIGNVYSPTHSVQVDRLNEHSAKVNYQATTDIPKTDLRLMISTTESGMAASWLGYLPDSSAPGYFMLLMHPSLESVQSKEPRDIVLVLDKSGSMRGEKMEQARQALLYVLDHLPEQDRFGIVVYDSQVMTFREKMADASDKELVRSAKSFVNALSASGGTNIEQGLDSAFKLLSQGDRKAYVVHLSDGRPTVGERDDRQIAAQAVKLNQRRARLFNFGVGHDVHSRLMDRLSSQCFGETFFVGPEEDIEQSVSTLYDRLGQPALSDVRWELVSDRSDAPCKVTMAYPTKINDIFVGNQVSLAGRYEGKGQVRLIITGKWNGTEQRYEQPIDLDSAGSRKDSSYIASIWASRRAASIIEEIDLEGQKEPLLKELMELAKKYGILTEYTAFLAEEPSLNPSSPESQRRLLSGLDRLKDEVGKNAFEQRSVNKLSKSAENLAQSEQVQDLSLRYRAAADMGGMGGASPRGALASGSNVPIALGSSVALSEPTSDYKQQQAGFRPVQRVGDRAFFFQNGQWVDSKLSERIPKDPKKVERFSEEYFALVEKHRDVLQTLLELEEPILVELDGIPYLL